MVVRATDVQRRALPWLTQIFIDNKCLGNQLLPYLYANYHRLLFAFSSLLYYHWVRGVFLRAAKWTQPNNKNGIVKMKHRCYSLWEWFNYNQRGALQCSHGASVHHQHTDYVSQPSLHQSSFSRGKFIAPNINEGAFASHVHMWLCTHLCIAQIR